MSALNYLDYARESGAFAHIAATTVCCGPTLFGGEPYPTPLASLKVSASYFDVFGAKAVTAASFAAGDDQPGHDQVVVLSHRVWASRFGSDPTLIGRTIRLDERPSTVIGVMPENSLIRSGLHRDLGPGLTRWRTPESRLALAAVAERRRHRAAEAGDLY